MRRTVAGRLAELDAAQAAPEDDEERCGAGDVRERGRERDAPDADGGRALLRGAVLRIEVAERDRRRRSTGSGG